MNQAFQYDPLNRISQVQETIASGGNSQGSGWTTTFGYDTFGKHVDGRNSARSASADFRGKLSAAQGRFTSPDPKMMPREISNPQAWNRYSYALNNPL